jgi:hypothetical protein
VRPPASTSPCVTAPQACLVANVIQHFLNIAAEFSNSAIAEDISKAISYVHSSGVMHDEVRRNPSGYVLKE